MGAYSRNIAVIRGLKDGFSADGGALSGLIKAEKYGVSLKIEVSLINFAPLSEGKYVTAVSDGKHTQILDGEYFEGPSEVDTGGGFAALICFVNGQVSPVASAVCGGMNAAALGIREEIERQENANTERPPQTPPPQTAFYEDEALAQENYYEFAQTDESGRAVCENPQEEKDGLGALEDEAAAGSVESVEDGLSRATNDSEREISRASDGYYGGESRGEKNAERGYSACDGADGAYFGAKDNGQKFGFKGESAQREAGKDAAGNLARGMCFYERMKGEIEGVLSTYPAEEALESTVENSRWARIDYGDGKYYVFGVIYGSGTPQYICYGVPAKSRRPPDSLEGLASFIPSAPDGGGKGYWVMYQDAFTGASVKIEAE